MNLSLPVEIMQQLASARAALERNMAGTLQAIHVFGSAVEGGLKPHSDIDLLVTVGAPLIETARRSLMMDLRQISAWPGTSDIYRALEVTVVVRDEVVPWRYPPMRELQFGEWLREELQAGNVRPATLDHDLAILLTMARKRSICLAGTPASELFDPVPEEDFVKALSDATRQWNEEPDWQGDERNVALALARIWFSASTGRIISKDAAAAWALERLPEEHRAVLANARAAYLGGPMNEHDHVPGQMAAFVRCIKSEIEGACPARFCGM